MNSNSISLSSNYPTTQNLIFQENIRVDSESSFTFNLENIENNDSSNLTIFKIEANFGDGVRKFYNSSFNPTLGVFVPLSSISHLYSSSLSSIGNNLSGSLIFNYKNGNTTTFRLGIKYINKNILDSEIRFVNNTSFTNKLSSNSLYNIVDKDNNFYNLVSNNKGFSKETGLEQTEFLNLEREFNKDILVGDKSYKVKSKLNEISDAIILKDVPKLSDNFNNLTASYSLRDIGAGSGPVVEVQRMGDGLQRDFTVNELQNGFIQTWVNAGGFDFHGKITGIVRTWYDQTGNGNHASTTSDLTGSNVPVTPSQKYQKGFSGPIIVKEGTYLQTLSTGCIYGGNNNYTGNQSVAGMQINNISQRVLGTKATFVVIGQIQQSAHSSQNQAIIGHGNLVQTQASGSMQVAATVSASVKVLSFKMSNEIAQGNSNLPIYIGSDSIPVVQSTSTTYSLDQTASTTINGLTTNYDYILITGYDGDNNMTFQKYNNNDILKSSFEFFPFIRGNSTTSLKLFRSSYGSTGYYFFQYHGTIKEVFVFSEEDKSDNADLISTEINDYYRVY
jgi:hypothetical protein